ncbi:hypothetical protein [Methanosphaera sp. WGK6]|uniref:hypothetical protein n=1 Tax=Methanosphaera sp. WGK6 TaxID=1561964 RepID=UPI00084BC4E9|nr:hypothetical protein [Methanosphaera sp. WGK6]OED29696.1 hypothetical protein NL43_06840 [Methanosphaera sp. WGK6]
MKLSPLQALVLIVVLVGIVYGTYSATMDQLPDLTGTVVGNTTNVANSTNQTIGTIYIHDETNSTSNMSVIITKNTKIYKESKDSKQVECKMNQLVRGSKVEVYTLGDPTNTIPPQVTAEKIVIKKSNK